MSVDVRRYGSGIRSVAVLLPLLVNCEALAHHPILGKFDGESTVRLTGIVSYVDWRNPHAHVFINVVDSGETLNWAVELESPITLEASGWGRESLRPGDRITVDGIRARNGSRQVWGEVVKRTGTGAELFTLRQTPTITPTASRAVPRWADGQPALGAGPGLAGGYWGHPSATALVEDGVAVAMNEYGLLENLDDAERVAPMQPWALALYRHRQSRHLQDDPMYLRCKPPGGVRQYQSRFGFQLIEDRETERIFVLIGSGNRNYRIIFLDGRDQVGLVSGDDDNPLYYGRSAGRWDGDTLVVDTRGFNEDFWFSEGGLPHTGQLRLIERFTRTSLDTLEYEVTIDDPGAYTRQWSASWTLGWIGGEDLPSHFCQHNRS